jgi:hypothetical protein
MASKMEEFFAIPDFSKLWLMPADTEAILIRTLLFRGDAWDVKVLPSGFIEGVPSCITVWVILEGGELSASGVNVSIEILENTWERTVFHDERAGGGHAFLTVTKTELELTSCVRNDFIPMRCTLTWIDTKKQEKTEGGSKWWCQLRRSLSQTLAALKISNSKSNLFEEASMVMTADVIPDRPSTIHHMITIPGYSKLAQMPAASKLTLRMFRFLGEAWSIILSPNGTNKTSTDSISIMAMRHSDPENTGSGIEVAIEILDKSHKQALIYKKQVLCDHNLCFRSILKLNKTELEAASCIKQEQQDKEKIGTIPRTTGESDSVRNPLLSTSKF